MGELYILVTAQTHKICLHITSFACIISLITHNSVSIAQISVHPNFALCFPLTCAIRLAISVNH